MDFQQLDKHLRTMNELETECFKSPRHLVFEGGTLSKPYSGFAAESEADVVPEGFIMNGEQKIAFSKHPRFAYVRNHRHSFIELNYVYSGSCTQTINGKRITLQEGELCLLDTNVVHSFEPAGERDIVINCLMRKSYFNTDMLSRLSGNDILSGFFINAVYKSKESNQYLLFPTRDNPKVRQWMTEALCEFYDPKLCSEEVINSYIILLFSELLRVFREHGDHAEHSTVKRAAITDILTYLESHYQTVTLASAARHFHFHPNYLSRALKKTFGQSFIKILIDIKMKKARVFLENTDFPVVKIAAEVGYTNLKHFYDHFKALCGATPAQYRRQAQQHA